MNFQPKLKEVEMKNMVKNICAAMVISLCAAGHLFATENNPNNDNKFMEENLNLIQEWDKTFPQSDKVDHKKITFHNRYGITLAADLYVPKNVTGKLPAIAISGPFGAVKEQASGLHAQTLAERGFLTIAFDPSYTGESSGQPRYVASPDINTEDFSAAVDYLSQILLYYQLIDLQLEHVVQRIPRHIAQILRYCVVEYETAYGGVYDAAVLLAFPFPLYAHLHLGLEGDFAHLVCHEGLVLAAENLALALHAIALEGQVVAAKYHILSRTGNGLAVLRLQYVV